MDSKIFLKLCSNLLSVPAFNASDMDKTLKEIEEKYCFNKILQPMLTADAMHYLIRSAKPGIIYEIIDYLNIGIAFFHFEEKVYILGPYAKNEYSESSAEELLIKNKLPGSMLLKLRLYCTSFNIVTTNQIQSTITQVISAFTDNPVSFDYRRLSGFISDTSDINTDERILSDTSYSEIYKRYDAENRFLNAVRLGDLKNVFNTFKDMAKESSFTTTVSKEVQNYYLSSASFSILIALTRKAAEESGLSVITINKITQKYIQMYSAGKNKSNNDVLVRYLEELVTAVKEHRLSYGTYSAPIIKALEYIELHLGEPISISTLSDCAGLSVSQLSRILKREVGESASAIISKMRCKKAANLLKTTDLPIGEISSFVGYADNNYFVKVFKKVYGMTPGDYRKK